MDLDTHPGVSYFPAGVSEIREAQDRDLYYYQAFIGDHTIDVERGDCVYHVSGDRSAAHLNRGPTQVRSPHCGIIVRGYTPDDKQSGVTATTNLPYVNGCSTRQVFAPERPGDPTLQILHMPADTAEQLHHVHPTVRVVYVLQGRGVSVVGMGTNPIRQELTPGMTIVLEAFCPHHFETQSESLTVLPLHIWSSIPAESNHPMFNGTIRA